MHFMKHVKSDQSGGYKVAGRVGIRTSSRGIPVTTLSIACRESCDRTVTGLPPVPAVAVVVANPFDEMPTAAISARPGYAYNRRRVLRPHGYTVTFRMR